MRASPITPTVCTGSSTANACQIASYRPAVAELLEEDRVGLAQHLEPLARDLAEDAHREAGAGERVPPDDRLGQAELAAERAHLVLEQLAQRLDQLELMRSGRPPTLWWILIVDAGPLTETDSMTSG